MSNGNKGEENAPRKKRSYRGHVQAEIAALTSKRVIEASLALFDEHWNDEITLEQIAERAGVTVQTILRHFGSKDQLATAVSQEAFRLATREQLEPVVGDLSSIAHSLINYYEAGGIRMLRGLMQEARQPHLHAIIDLARSSHNAWIEQVFAPFFEQVQDVDARKRLLAQLSTLTGVYTWYQLRYEAGLSCDETERALYELLKSLLIYL